MTKQPSRLREGRRKGNLTGYGRSVLVLLALLALMPAQGIAGESPAAYYYLRVGAYVHFSSSPNHKGAPVLVAIERHWPDDRFLGLALFPNSFGQFSQAVYYGWSFPLPRIHEGVYFELAAGVIHGYKGEHRDAIPFNHSGIAPAVVPALGYRRERWGVDMALLGAAGVLFTLDYRFGN